MRSAPLSLALSLPLLSAPAFACTGSAKNVGSGQSFTTIQAAVNAIVSGFVVNECVTIMDSATYNEQVVISAKAPGNATARIVILANAGQTPVIDPPAGSTAAFRILNSSVTLQDLRIQGSNPVPWGVVASSGDLIIDGTTISQTGYRAGLAFASRTVITDSFVAAGDAVAVLAQGSTSTIANSTITAQTSGFALDVSSAVSLTVSNSYVANREPGFSLSGVGVYVGPKAQNTLITGTTIFVDSNFALRYGVYVDRSTDTTIELSRVHGDYNDEGGSGEVSGYAMVVTRAVQVRVASSTIRADHAGTGSPDNQGIVISRSTDAIVSNSTITALGPFHTQFSTGTQLLSSYLHPGAFGTIVWLNSGNKNVRVHDNRIHTNPSDGAGGVVVFNGQTGLIEITSNTMVDVSQGVWLSSHAAGSRVVISSNTIYPGGVLARQDGSEAFNIAGLDLKNLPSGATVQANAVYFRRAANIEGFFAYGLRMFNVHGAVVKGNRFNNANAYAANTTGLHMLRLIGAQRAAITFNDVASTGTVLAAHHSIRATDGSTNLRLFNNAIYSSHNAVGVSTLAIVVDSLSQTGFQSDFNLFFNPGVPSPAGLFGGATCLLPAWTACSGGTGPTLQDQSSQRADPLWRDLGNGREDFHPRSSAGRYDPASQTFVNDGVDSPLIDAGDPDDKFGGEPLPNGNQANIGSYGNHLEGSKTGSGACAIRRRVHKTNGPYVSVRGAGLSLPSTLPGNACVHVEDGAVYAEQLTLRNVDSDGFRTHVAGLALLPFTLDPPALSTAGVQIAMSSVTLMNLNVEPGVSVAYGVLASSAYVELSSVAVDGAAAIWTAGVQLSSFSTVQHSTLTTVNAVALQLLQGPGTLIDRSTATNASSSRAALHVSTSAGVTITRSNIVNTIGRAANLINSALYDISKTSVSGAAGLFAQRSASGTIANSLFNGAAGFALYIDTGSFNSEIAFSTFATQSSAAAALEVNGSSRTTFLDVQAYNGLGFAARLGQASTTTFAASLMVGATAFTITDSTSTVLNGLTLIATHTAGSAFWMQDGNVGFSATTTTFRGGPRGHSAFVDRANIGLIHFSSSSLESSPVGLRVSTLPATARPVVQSTLIRPTLIADATSYGVFLNGLTAGATIQETQIFFHIPGALGNSTAYGVRAQTAAGLYLDHNRINNPGTVLSGSFEAISLSDADRAWIRYNDVHSSGTSLTNAYLLRLEGGSINAVVRSNVFASSHAVTGSSATVSVPATSQTGYNSDYNTWYSSTSRNTGVWGTSAHEMLVAWRAATGKDANSISGNPLWRSTNAGLEDFHPLSEQGRWDFFSTSFVQDGATSPTIDAADPDDGEGAETPPNNAQPNQGSFGRTIEASLSPPDICPITRRVHQTNGPLTSIQAAVDALPATITQHACVLIEDGATYAESVRMLRFDTSVASITIRPAGSLRPLVSPPATSTAAFHITASSITIERVDIAVAASVPYGIKVSSPYVHIDSVTITSLGNLYKAGVELVGYSTISFSSVTLNTSATGFLLLNSTRSFITSSTAATNGVAVHGVNADFSSFTFVTASGTAVGFYFDSNTSSPTVSFSSAVSGGVGALLSRGAYIYDSYLRGVARLDLNADEVVIERSTTTGGVDADSAGAERLRLSLVDSYGSIQAGSEMTMSSCTVSVITGEVFKCVSRGLITVEYSTFTGGFNGLGAMEFDGCSTNTLRSVYVQTTADPAVRIHNNSMNYTLSDVRAFGEEYGLYLTRAGTITVTNGHFEAQRGMLVSASTATTVRGAVIRSTLGNQDGLLMNLGSRTMFLIDSTVTSGPQAHGVAITTGASGVIELTSNTISGSYFGIKIDNLLSGYKLRVSSNVVLSSAAATGGVNSGGIRLSSLTQGATVQLNSIYFRGPASVSPMTAFGMEAAAVQGLVFTRNRINNPGIVTGGGFTGLHLGNSPRADLQYNDFHSSGTSLTNAYLLRVTGGSNNVRVRNNVFASSFTVSGVRALIEVDAASQSGFASDYNSFFSSNSLTFLWGLAGPSTLGQWQAASLEDDNSVETHPRWADVSSGQEDFHPLSSKGRWVPATQGFVQDLATSGTIDRADLGEPYDEETTPNGERANLGSYGNTSEASRSSALCTTQVNVPSGQATIQAAINALPSTLTTNACVVIENSATYAEQVEIRNKTTNGFRIEVRSDPDLAARPTIAPPAGSTAAFILANASASVRDVNITPSAAVTWGVLISSDEARVSSVTIAGAAFVSYAGIRLSSFTRVSDSTVTVTGAEAFAIWGATTTGAIVQRSTASASSRAALMIEASTGAAVTGVRAAGSGSEAGLRVSNAYGTIIEGSDLASASGSGADVAGSTGTRVNRTHLSGTFGAAIRSGSVDTVVFASTATGTTAVSVDRSSGAAFYDSRLSGSSSGLSASASTATTVAGGTLSASAGTALQAASGRDVVVATATLSGLAGGVRVSDVSGGTIRLSSITASGRAAVHVASAAASTYVELAHSLLLPAPSNAQDTAGVLLDGLAGGATVQNNDIYYRTAASGAGFTSYGVLARTSAGLLLLRNRVNQPAQVAAGSFAAVRLADADRSELLFNDVHSVATGLTDAWLLRVGNGSTGVKVENNVFASSHSASGVNLMAAIDADSQSGFESDFNNWYSSNSVFSSRWGGSTFALLPAWQAGSGQDANSRAVHPRWPGLSAGGEDFHPLSVLGRWSPALGAFTTDAEYADTIDGADTARPYDNETVPNGSRANLGSYGDTAEASRSAPALSAVAPTQVAVSSVQVTFTNTAPADGFRVDASSSGDFSGELFSTEGSVPPLWITGLQANVTYFLRAGALYGSQYRFTASAPVSTPTLTAVPASFASAVTELNTIRLAWSANGNSNGTTYEAVISTDNFATLVASSRTLASAATFFNLSANIPHHVRVRAVNHGGMASNFTGFQTVSVPPAPPTSTAVLGRSSSSVTLDWLSNGNLEPGTDYQVFYDVNASFLSPGMVRVSHSSAVVSGLNAATQYHFRVRAMDSLDFPGEFGATVSTETLPPAPSAPGAPSGTALSVDRAEWSWGTATFASSYTLRVASDTASVWAGAVGPPATLVGLSTNAPIGVVVAAHNASGMSPLSTSATVYTLAAPSTGTYVPVIYRSSAVYGWGLNENPSYTVASVERSTDDASWSTVFTGAQSSYTEIGLLECTSYYVRVRNVNGDGIATAYDASAFFRTSGSTSAPPGLFTAESLSGQRVSFNWAAPSAGNLEGYRLYWDAGTGTMDFVTPVAALPASATSYVSGVLLSSASLRFVLRAVNCGIEEAAGATALAASTATLSAVRAALRSPLAGAKLAGGRVTLVGELVAGAPADASSVRFQYRPSAATAWTDVVPADAAQSNPDSSYPYFVNWDVTGLADGGYQLRAVASDTGLFADDAATTISVEVANSAGDQLENLSGGVLTSARTVYSSIDNTVWSAGPGGLIKVALPAGALSASSATLTIVNGGPAPAPPPPGVQDAGLRVSVSLGSGQTQLGTGATITMFYADADGDEILDNTAFKASTLRFFSYDTLAGRWKPDLSTSYSGAGRSISGVTTHFSDFSAFPAQASADLSTVVVYPVPFKPNGTDPDEGRPYSASDPNTGITFGNLPSAVEIKIYTLSGELVAELSSNDSFGTLRWDALAKSGRPAASGLYFAVITSPGRKGVVKKLSILR